MKQEWGQLHDVTCGLHFYFMKIALLKNVEERFGSLRFDDSNISYYHYLPDYNNYLIIIQPSWNRLRFSDLNWYAKKKKTKNLIE